MQPALLHQEEVARGLRNLVGMDMLPSLLQDLPEKDTQAREEADVAPAGSVQHSHVAQRNQELVTPAVVEYYPCSFANLLWMVAYLLHQDEASVLGL